MTPFLAVLLIDDIIIFLIIQIVLAAATYFLAGKAKPPDNPFADESKPPTLAERGAYLPWVRGFRKVGPIVLCVSNRKRIKYRVDRTDQYKYVETSWHGLAIGPGYSILSIRKDGKLISRGPINRDTHPSGTKVSLGAGIGSYFVYWGEDLQAVNTYLGAADRVGVPSRWPHMFYVVWVDFELGPQPIWPQLDYTIRCDVENSGDFITGTSPHYEGTRTLMGSSRPIQTILNPTGIPAGSSTVRKEFQVTGDHRTTFPGIGGYIRLTGNAIYSDRDLRVIRKRYITVIYLSGVISKHTGITVEETLTGITATGRIQGYKPGLDDGPNGAHVIAELLFADWPLGMGFDAAEHNLDDLEALGSLLLTEKISTHINAKDGENCEDVLKALLDDLGVVVGWDPRMAKWRYLSIRQSTTVPMLSEDQILDPLPTIKTMHGEPSITKTVFTYVDRSHRFRSATAPITSDDAENIEPRSRQSRVEMKTIVNFSSAVTVSERRSQEAHATVEDATFDIFAGRDARYLFPGLRIDAEGIEPRLLIMSTRPDWASGKCELNCVTDYYGAVASAAQSEEAGGLPDTDPEDPDIDTTPEFTEPPEGWASPPPGGSLGAGGPSVVWSDAHPQLCLLHFRASDAITSTRVFVAATDDDEKYREIATIATYQTGGCLTRNIDASEGPTIDEIPFFPDGVDLAALAQDLTADEPGWRAGKQLAFINGEIFFVKSVEIIDEESAILHDCIRARWATKPAEHLVDSAVYVCPPEQVETFADELIKVGATVFFKTIPTTGGVSFGLDEVDAVEVTIAGTSVVPRAPVNLTTEDRTGTWASGDDITIGWNYFAAATCRTGAGETPSGYAIEAAEPAGHFSIEIQTDDGSTTVRTIQRSSVANYVYLEADRVADFAGEPTEFRIVVRQHRCGYTSEPTTSNLTRI